jgi:hypothetical protein
MEELTARCECHSPDHTVFFDYDGEGGELYLTVHLTTHRGFWKRLWYGIKYAFGYQCRYGAWDEVILRQRDCAPIRALLDKREAYHSKFVRDSLERKSDASTKEPTK